MTTGRSVSGQGCRLKGAGTRESSCQSSKLDTQSLSGRYAQDEELENRGNGKPSLF
jgi:hypothetical protein